MSRFYSFISADEDFKRERDRSEKPAAGSQQEPPRTGSAWRPGPKDEIEQAICRAVVQSGMRMGGAAWDSFLSLAVREILATGPAQRKQRRKIGEMDIGS